MEIKNDYSFSALQDSVWSGAVETMETVAKNDKEDELMELLAEVFTLEIPTLTEVNDFLWFEWEFIFETLGISEDESEDEE